MTIFEKLQRIFDILKLQLESKKNINFYFFSNKLELEVIDILQKFGFQIKHHYVTKLNYYHYDIINGNQIINYFK